MLLKILQLIFCVTPLVLSLILYKKPYRFMAKFHASFYIRVVLTAIYKFPFYMLQARNACDMGISIAFELPVR